MRGTLLLGLVLIAALASGCQTAVGNYFGNRARDFGECWRGEVTGPQVGFGVGVRAAGLLDVGIGGSFTARSDWASWVYGDWRVGYAGLPELMDFGQAVELESFLGRHQHDNARWRHECWGVLPCLLSWAATAGHDPNSECGESRWIWHSDVRSRLHAFDTEVSVHAFLFGIRVGFSPGEFLDFFLGWFGLDIAGDDHALAVPAVDGS